MEKMRSWFTFFTFILCFSISIILGCIFEDPMYFPVSRPRKIPSLALEPFIQRVTEPGRGLAGGEVGVGVGGGGAGRERECFPKDSGL